MTPLTPAGQALYDDMRESAVGLPERLTGQWPYHDAIAKVEAQAADRALAELRREVEGLADSVPFWGPGTAVAIEPDGYFIDRAAVLALIDKASKPDET